MSLRAFLRSAAALLLVALLSQQASSGIVTQAGSRCFNCTSATDTTPDAFTFTDQTGVATSSTITSAAVSITGINASTTCNATGGTIDKNSAGSFASSQSVVNNDTIRARHTSSASNSTATNTVVNCNGVSDTFTSTTTSGASGVFFNPDLESFAVGAQPVGPNGFDAHNGVPHAVISTDYALPGKTKSIKLTYDVDESGDDLIVYGPSAGGKFVPTATLFARSYERFEGPWEGHWPLGLKTARYFTTDDLVTTGSSMPGALAGQYSYLSEKLLYPSNDGTPDPRTLDYVAAGNWAYLHNSELSAIYTSGQVFGNGLPYIRTGHWYKFERWMVQNSAMDVADGILQVWIDDVLVMNLTNVKYKESGAAVENPIPNGTEWRGMWFGGNHSNGVEGTPLPQGNVYRYISDPYLSTTLDR